MKRRDLLRRAGMAAAAFTLPPLARANALEKPVINSTADPSDESYWKKFARDWYDVSDDFVNLENGYFGVQPKPVLQAYLENAQKLNQRSSRLMRKEFYQHYFPAAMYGLYDATGAEEGELLLTRNATEALNIAIQGMDLRKGDEVILQHHDYPSMIDAYKMLEQQKGIKLVFLDVPLIPESREEIVELYLNAITPHTRCILLTHLTHLTGQIMPVAEISRRAREQNVSVIVDAAHSFAQMDYKIKDLEADFVGMNLHKWFGNPLGAGLLYVRKGKVSELTPLFGDIEYKDDDIRKLGHFGTPAAPIVMTLKAAYDFNKQVGIGNKEARLRYLQQYWTNQARSMERVEVVTPADPAQSCAIASFRMKGMDSYDVARILDEKFGVFTVIRHLKEDVVVRVTPNLYNGTKDLDVLLDGLQQMSRQ